MDKRSARNRWSLTTEARQKVKAISRFLLKENTTDRDFSKMVARTEEGLLDLRGIPLLFEPGMELRKIRIRETDFSYAQFGHTILKECIFEHVIFEELHNSRWNERGCRFINVDFSKAKLHNAGIGVNGSVYERVKFRGTDFTGASFIRPQFFDCDFSKAKLKKLDFNASNFVNCKFNGKLESVWFRRYYPLKSDEQSFGKAVPNEMRNVDFSKASLWDVMFTGGLDLSDVILPPDGSHILFHHFDVALRKLQEKVEDLSWTNDEKKEVMIWIEGFLTHAVNQPMWILNKGEFLTEFGRKIGVEFISLLQAFDDKED